MKKPFLYVLLYLLQLPIIPAFLVIYIVLGSIGCVMTSARRRTRKKPRLLWGVTPIINIHYYSNCMAQSGYNSKTHVLKYYSINSRNDFDYCRSDLLEIPVLGALLWIFSPFVEFLCALLRFDIFHYFFDGGILARTPLKYCEIQLLHLAGKIVMATTYGSDAYVYSRVALAEVRHVLQIDYGENSKYSRMIERQVDYFTRRADFIITSIMSPDGIPRWDMLPVSHLIIDTDSWKDCGPILKEGRVRFFHAPNHRGTKGTEFLLAAVDRLKRENFPVDLVLAEKVSNSRVKEMMGSCDVVLDQLVIFGYAMTAMEGMAQGKIVVSNMSSPYYRKLFSYYSYLDECPVVSATPESVYSVLLDIVKSREKYADLGKRGRDYVEKFHSFAAGKLMWERAFKKIWYGENVDTINYYHPILGDFYNERRDV